MQDRAEIERRLSLVLKKPQHYHVTVIAYETATDNGFTWSTAYTLVANDIALAVDRAKAHSGKPNAHVKDVMQCSDPQHLEGID